MKEKREGKKHLSGTGGWVATGRQAISGEELKDGHVLRRRPTVGDGKRRFPKGAGRTDRKIAEEHPGSEQTCGKRPAAVGRGEDIRWFWNVPGERGRDLDTLSLPLFGGLPSGLVFDRSELCQMLLGDSGTGGLRRILRGEGIGVGFPPLLFRPCGFREA